jgi:hypothetical protein
MGVDVTDITRSDLDRLVRVKVPGVLTTTEQLQGSRCIGTCRCGHTTSVVVWRIARDNRRTPAADAFQDQARFDSRYGIVTACSSCGAQLTVEEIVGRFKVTVPCDTRCTSAKGRKCECSCGGHNHGIDHN